MSDRRMIYSLDLKTTGKSVYCQILEVGIIALDMDLPCEPLAQLKRFHTYVTHDCYRGEAYAMSMHGQILRRIATEEPGWTYTPDEKLAWAIKCWAASVENGELDLDAHGEPILPDGPFPMQFAGKNFGRFASQILNELSHWEEEILENPQSFDPSILYFDHSIDRELPDMKTCLQRAAARTVARTGVDQGFGLLETKHDAIGEAELVVKLLRAAWDIDEDQAQQARTDD